MDVVIGKHFIKHPQRGYSMYPSNGRMITRIMVKLEGETVARRVYDKFMGSKAKKAERFRPVIMVKDVEVLLTPEQAAQIGYDFATCRSYK